MTCKAAAVDMVAAVEVVDMEVRLRLSYPEKEFTWLLNYSKPFKINLVNGSETIRSEQTLDKFTQYENQKRRL